MYKKLSFLFLTAYMAVNSLQAMEPANPEPAKDMYIPQTACPHPVYLINDSDEDLDITIIIDSNTVTEQNAYILKAILAGITGFLPCHDLEERTDQAIVTKFKGAKFEFTIKPHDSLLLPGLATGQKIALWKKRWGINTLAYQLPLQEIEELVKSSHGDRKKIVQVYVKPCLGLNYGFNFQQCLTEQEDNYNLKQLNQRAIPLDPAAIADDIPVCLDPVRLFNKSEEDLNIRIITNPNNTITKNGNLLQFILVSLTAGLNLDDMNGIMAQNIQDKFRKAEFDFSIKPSDNLLIPGIAAKQEILVWKKRGGTDVKSYSVPLNKIEQSLSVINRKDMKNTVHVFITPSIYLWGFYFDVSTVQEKTA